MDEETPRLKTIRDKEEITIGDVVDMGRRLELVIRYEKDRLYAARRRREFGEDFVEISSYDVSGDVPVLLNYDGKRDPELSARIEERGL